MAQLSDDCFAVGDEALTLARARADIAARLEPLARLETVPLDAADGRVAAHDIPAPGPLPPFFNSAVDGYAVRHADLGGSGPTRLLVIGRIQAGEVGGKLPPGAAARIFTGAPMPEGADTVFMQEDAAREGDVVVLPAGLKRGANARPAGEERQAGAVLVPAGRRLRPQEIGLLASAGLATVAVRARPRVALFSTGNELVDVTAQGALAPGRVRDANRPLLAALLRRAGAEVSDLGILRDDPAALRAALAAAAPNHDLLLTSGGVSTGEADHVKDAVAALGRLDHWRFAIKPGRPLSVGVVAGAAFVGLPGNPVAVFVTFTQVVGAMLARLGGEAWRPPRLWRAEAAFEARKKAGRREFVRVSLEDREGGAPLARRYPVEGAGILSSLTDTDGLAVLPEDATGVARGDPLDVLPFEGLL